MSRNIDKDRMRTICKIGKGASCCRYMTANSAGIQCAKHTDLRAIIDKRVAEGMFTAIADNCEGLGQ